MKAIYHFQSQDRRFAVTMTARCVQTMLREAGEARGAETGGILVGHYNDQRDTAVVTSAEPPPPDSHGTVVSFRRGVKGVHALLHGLWNKPKRTYYLGEWHVHPGFSAERSSTDDSTMHSRTLRDAFQCEVPVLVILGGSPTASWHLQAWAYEAGAAPIPLLELNGP